MSSSKSNANYSTEEELEDELDELTQMYFFITVIYYLAHAALSMLFCDVLSAAAGGTFIPAAALPLTHLALLVHFTLALIKTGIRNLKQMLDACP